MYFLQCFSSIKPSTITTYKIFVIQKIGFAIVQTIPIVLILQRLWFLISRCCPIIFSVSIFSMNEVDNCRKLLLLVKILMNKLKLFLCHTCLTDWFWKKQFDGKKQANSFLYRNKYTVLLIEKNFYSHNQYHFLFLFQRDNCSVMQDIVLVSQRVVLLKENSPCPPLVEQNEVFCWSYHLRVFKSCLGQMVISSWSEDRVYMQLINFEVELNIVQFKHLMTAWVHILCTYTWDHFVHQLHSLFLVRSNCKSC